MIYKFEIFLIGSRTAVLVLEWRHVPRASLALWGSTDAACWPHVVSVVWCVPTADYLERKAKGWEKAHSKRRIWSTDLTHCTSALSGHQRLLPQLLQSTQTCWFHLLREHETTQKTTQVTVRHLYQNFFVEFAERALFLIHQQCYQTALFLLECDMAGIWLVFEKNQT